jgi:hypothetical protein
MYIFMRFWTDRELLVQECTYDRLMFNYVFAHESQIFHFMTPLEILGGLILSSMRTKGLPLQINAVSTYIFKTHNFFRINFVKAWSSLQICKVCIFMSNVQKNTISCIAKLFKQSIINISKKGDLNDFENIKWIISYLQVQYCQHTFLAAKLLQSEKNWK